MKSQFQILQFLSNYTPKTALDRQFIEAFLEKNYHTPHQRLRNAPNFNAKPLDVYSFTQWLESGSEALKIAKYEGSTVILGECTLETAKIIGILEPDGSISTNPSIVPQSMLSDTSDSEMARFRAAVLSNNLEPCPQTLTLVSKTIPAINDRVIFHTFDLRISGVGVISDIDPKRDFVELYCYFIYPNYATERRIGYSMHETGIVNLSEYSFVPITEDNQQTILGNGTSCVRRLNTELEKEGKIWKDKLHRIEPLIYEGEPGSKYWYINDKLKVVQEVDKGTAVSHLRYIAGNYFTDSMAAQIMAGEICEKLRDYLASPDWPRTGREPVSTDPG